MQLFNQVRIWIWKQKWISSFLLNVMAAFLQVYDIRKPVRSSAYKLIGVYFGMDIILTSRFVWKISLDPEKKVGVWSMIESKMALEAILT